MELAFTKTKYQDEFVFYPKDQIIGQSMYRYGEYQQLEIDFLLQHINYDSVVWDIGANIGVHACAFASKAKQVHCFEPNQMHCEALYMNIKANTGCEIFVYPQAITNRKCQVIIENFDPEQISNYGTTKITQNPKHGNIVEADRLDNINIPAPHLIKIDVEGHEPEVLQGCEQTIVKNNPIVYMEAMSNCDRIYDFFESKDYNLWWTCVMNYNVKNFKGAKENMFGNSAMFGLVAAPSLFNYTQLNKMQSRDEHWTTVFNAKDLSND